MGKSIRSKIKRYWRAEFRNTIGKAYLHKQEAHIQDQLKKSLEKQGGGSLLKLSQQLGNAGAKPVVSESLATDVEEDMNVEEGEKSEKTSTKSTSASRPRKKKKGKKFAFYVVKKKGA